MAIVQVSIVPLGTGTTSASQYVARALSILENEKEVAYQLTPMATIIEGDLDKLLSTVSEMHESAFDEKVQRVLTTITIDDRRDRTATMESKVKSVRNKLGKR
ncbi:MTH1187 family thiamine-binding protein [Chloroflexota bacterium]